MKSVGTRRVGRAASTPEGLLKICNDCNADLVPSCSNTELPERNGILTLTLCNFLFYSGDRTHMSRISFITTPLSPIVNLVPVAIPRNRRGLFIHFNVMVA